MVRKPSVALLDADPQVQLRWQKVLGASVVLVGYTNYRTFFEEATLRPGLIGSYSCLILGLRLGPDSGDVCTPEILDSLRASGGAPLFLNWEGELPAAVRSRADGRLRCAGGVSWSSLKAKIYRYEKQANVAKLPRSVRRDRSLLGIADPSRYAAIVNRDARCQTLVADMASRADGVHQAALRHYAQGDSEAARQLLRAIYYRLVTSAPSDDCPSRYIHSSPVIAKRILEEALGRTPP